MHFELYEENILTFKVIPNNNISGKIRTLSN